MEEFVRDEETVYSMQRNQHNSKDILNFIVKFTKKANKDAMKLLTNNCKTSLFLLSKVEQFLIILECKELIDILSLTYNNLACVCRELKDFDMALKFLDKALDLCELNDRNKYKALIYLNMCNVYRKLNKDKAAFNCATKASLQCQEDISSHANSKTIKKQVELLGVALYNMGVQEERLGNLTSALNWYIKGLNTLNSDMESNNGLKLKLQKGINRLNEVVLNKSVEDKKKVIKSKHKYLISGSALFTQRAICDNRKSSYDKAVDSFDSLQQKLQNVVVKYEKIPARKKYRSYVQVKHPKIKHKNETLNAKKEDTAKKEDFKENKESLNAPLKSNKIEEGIHKLPLNMDIKSPIDFDRMEELFETVMVVDNCSYLIKFLLYEKELIVIKSTSIIKGTKQTFVLPKELHRHVIKSHGEVEDVEREIGKALAEFLAVKKTEDLLQFNWEKIKEFTNGRLDMTKEYDPLSKTLVEPTMEKIISKEVKGYGMVTVFLNKEDKNLILIQLEKRRIERKLSRLFTAKQAQELMNNPRKLRMTLEYYLPQLISSTP